MSAAPEGASDKAGPLAGLEAAPLFETPEAICPAAGQAAWVDAPDGTGKLRVAHFAADRSQRGHVLLFVGKAEFIEKYYEVIGDLRARGFSVTCWDWRGQGLSVRPLRHRLKAHIERFDTFLDDAERIISHMTSAHSGPVIALGHSMGGNILLRLLARGRFVPSLAVLSAPMTGILLRGVPDIAVKALLFAARQTDRLTAFLPGGEGYDPVTEPFDGNPVTHDPRRFAHTQALLKAHPELGQGAATFGWLAEARQSIRVLMAPKALSQVACPVLVLSAAEDKLVDPASHRVLADRLPKAEYFSFTDAAHELFSERDGIRQKVWVRIDRFLADHLQKL
ncbi:MAG: alpha/beta hydrolase [Pseudomonadota bacterium]